MLKYGSGWKAVIYAPNNAFALPYTPLSIDPSSHKDIFEQAKKIVGRALGH
jgi:hypothetical protein